jgi:multidrug efflux pump subunit AcrB
MTPSVVKVRDKMLANLDFMPPGVRTPLVKPKEIDDVSIVNLTLWSKSLDDGQLRSQHFVTHLDNRRRHFLPYIKLNGNNALTFIAN